MAYRKQSKYLKDGELDYTLEKWYYQGKEDGIIIMSILNMSKKQIKKRKNIIAVAWHRLLKKRPLWKLEHYYLFNIT